jgi:predicted nucleotidyltransferase
MHLRSALAVSTASPQGRGLTTLAQLRARREEILRLAAEYGAADPGSDVDFLVDVVTDARGFAYFGLLGDLRRALASALDFDVDVVDSAGRNRLREPILREAVPL